MFHDIDGSSRCLVLPLVLLLTIPGCVYIINREPVVLPSEAPGRTTLCEGEFIPPPIPAIPVISQDDLRDRNKSDTILVDKIKELRQYAKDLQEGYKEHRRLVMEECSKS